MQRDFPAMVYIMASARNGTLYVGVTSNLMQRVVQHRSKDSGGFTAKYDVKMLVWFDPHSTMQYAITREKQLKTWNRAWKLDLIEQTNPNWCDLAVELGLEPPR